MIKPSNSVDLEAIAHFRALLCLFLSSQLIDFSTTGLMIDPVKLGFIKIGNSKS